MLRNSFRVIDIKNHIPRGAGGESQYSLPHAHDLAGRSADTGYDTVLWCSQLCPVKILLCRFECGFAALQTGDGYFPVRLCCIKLSPGIRSLILFRLMDATCSEAAALFTSACALAT